MECPGGDTAEGWVSARCVSSDNRNHKELTLGHPCSARRHNYLNGRWGLTRQLLYNAVKGVTEGHSIVLRLVGVGYRATVEDEDRHVESDLEKWFKPGTRTFFVSKVQEEAYRNMLAAEREKKEPWKRLALRL